MDFGFRQYDPQIGRFLGVDPLADYYGQDRYSPYAAMGNQPESMIDPNGLKYESTYQGVHHYSTYFVDNGGYYKKSYGEKTMMDMRIEGIEGHIFNFIGSLGGASFSSEMQTQINNNAFWNYMMYIYLKSEGNFSLKAENNMLRLSFQTSWSENRVVVIQLNIFYIDLSSFGKSDYNNNQQSNGGQLGNIGTGVSALAGGLSLAGDSRVSWLVNNNYRSGVYGNYQLTGRNLSLFGSRVTSYSMPTSKLITYGSKLGKLGTVVGGAGLLYDGYQVSQGNLGLGRFGYRLAGFGASVGAGALAGSAFGGPIGTGVGACVGVGFGAGEIIYDEVIQPKVAEPFNRSFNSFIKGYFNIPGW